MCIFMPKCHSLPFLVWCISGSRLLVLFLVELGAEIMVASAMLPSRSIRPFFSTCLFTSLNSALPRPYCSRKCRKVPHGLNLEQSIFHRRVAQVIEQLHAVDSQHGRQRIRRSSVLALGVITGYLLFKLLPGNQLLHPLQEDLATSLALLGLVLGFGECNLIHGGIESYAVDDGRIIANFETYSESP